MPWLALLLPVPSFHANAKRIIHCQRHVMSSSNHHERLLCTWSSASVFSLFLKYCISVCHCSLTNVCVQPALIKSNMRRPWPLCGSLSKCPGNKWDVWKGWVHLERWGSGTALWAPSFSSSDLIDLNLKKSGVIMTETHGREGSAQALTSLWPWRFREREFEEEAEAPEVLLYALRTFIVAPWEAAFTVVKNHKEASCPVMIYGETNGLWSSIICETNSIRDGANAIIHNQTAWLRKGTAIMQFTALRDPGISDYIGS